jgi:16S rRNA (guanine527-N7)-methyltransferase
MKPENLGLLISSAAALGVPLDATALDLLGRYLDLLNKWNRALNLTAEREEKKQVVRSLVDSLAAATVAPEQGRVLDLGSGAGLPGYPIKFARPGIEITLAESRQKKADFLKAVARELGLTGVKVHAGRAEELGREGEAKFDVVLVRAVAELSELVLIARPLLAASGRCVSGSLVAMKGPEPKAEIEAAAGAMERAGLRVLEVRYYDLLGRDGRRSLVILGR